MSVRFRAESHGHPLPQKENVLLIKGVHKKEVLLPFAVEDVREILLGISRTRPSRKGCSISVYSVIKKEMLLPFEVETVREIPSRISRTAPSKYGTHHPLETFLVWVTIETKSSKTGKLGRVCL